MTVALPRTRRKAQARRLSMLLGGVLTLAMAPLAASADSGSPAPTGSASAAADTFTIGTTTDVDSLNPFTGIDANAYEIYQLEYPTLTEYAAKDFTTVPGLATSWTESPDHTTWTYKLRDGVKWSDGQPLTSADVVYSFERVLNGQYEQTNYSAYTNDIASVSAPDATTVVFTVKRPSPIMLHLYVYILPKHIWKDISETQVKSYTNEPTPGSPTVGAGAYTVVERQTGQFVRLVANPNYYGGMPRVKNLVFRIYNNPDALGQALKKGEVDYADSLDTNVYNSLANVPGVTRVAATYSGFDEFAFNTGAALKDGTAIGNGNPALKNASFRRAVSWGVDRKTLLERVFNGYGSVGDSIIPPIYQSLHWTPTADELIGYDPVKAGQLLDAAGYKLGTNNLRTTPAGTPLSLRLLGRSDSASSTKAIQYLQGYLTQIGISSTVKLVASDALTEIIGQGNYDIFEWGWVIEPDPNYQLSTFTCGKRSYKDAGQVYADLSDSFYCNPAYDQLFAEQSGITDPVARAVIVKQMQALLYQDSPYIVYANYDDNFAYRSDRWTGFIPQPEQNGVYLFQYGTWSYSSLRPVSAAAVANSGMNLGLVGGGAVLAVLVVGGIVVLGRRRKTATSQDRE